VFGLHPVQVCVTTFIGGRTDTLALFFLCWYAIGLLHAAPIPARAGRARCAFAPAAWGAVALVAFACAVFTKEQCIPLALLAPLLYRGRTGRARLLLFGLPVLGYAVAAYAVLGHTAIPQPHWTAALRIEMVGRTPEYLGKKIGAYEIKVSLLSMLVLALSILGFSAWASVSSWGLAGLNNSGPHGLSEILYAFTSATGNNGSAKSGWNLQNSRAYQQRYKKPRHRSSSFAEASLPQVRMLGQKAPVRPET